MTDEFDVNEKNIKEQNTVSVENKAKLDKDDSADELLSSLEEIIDDSENNAEADLEPKADLEPEADPLQVRDPL